MTTVEYAKVFNLGNYENERIFFSDEVQPGETPGEAFERVKGWVLAKHDETMASRSLMQRKNEEIWELENKLQRAEGRAHEVVGYWRRGVNRYNELRELLAKHGVDLPELDSYYLPPAPAPEPGEFVASDDQADDDQADYSEE